MMPDPRAFFARVMDAVRELFANTIQLAPYALSTKDGYRDKVEGFIPQDDPQSGDKKYDLDGRRAWPFGIRSRPPKGVQAVWLRVGRSPNGVIVGADSSRYGPSDLDDGEVALYNKVSGVVVRLTKDGDVIINAASGRTVQINGSSYSLLNTETFLTALKAWVTAVNTVLGSNCVNGATLTAYSAQGPTLAAFDPSSSSYKSSKAKNG